jgi:low temperature requirement protein LtrA
MLTPTPSDATPPRRGVVWNRPPTLRAFDDVERHSTWLELFFDLCFVAAVAALATGLHESPNAFGLLRFIGLFVPVWWAWMGFTWYATAFDSDDGVFRLTLLGAMLAVIGLSASLLNGSDRTLSGFVVAYAAMQGLLTFLFVRVRRHVPAARRLAGRYAVGDGLGVLLWLGSLLAPPPHRYGLWAVGMTVLLVTPILAIQVLEWESYESTHIPERYGLFTLIVLGESIVSVVSATARTGMNPESFLTGAAGFGIAACVWWIYFDFVKVAALSRENLVGAFVWGYGHLLIFAGIAAAAVGVRLAVEGTAESHPLAGGARLVLGAGLASYLIAIAAIHVVTVQRLDGTARIRFAAALAVIALAALGGGMPALPLMALLLATFAGASLIEIVRGRP